MDGSARPGLVHLPREAHHLTCTGMTPTTLQPGPRSGAMPVAGCGWGTLDRHGQGLDRLDPCASTGERASWRAGSAATLNDRSVGAARRGSTRTPSIGTHAGLNIKAGDTLLSFHHDPNDPVSLPSDHLLALHRDRRGNMWVGTRGGGLALAELEQGFRCRRFGTDKEWLPRTVHGLADGPSGSLGRDGRAGSAPVCA